MDELFQLKKLNKNVCNVESNTINQNNLYIIYKLTQEIEFEHFMLFILRGKHMNFIKKINLKMSVMQIVIPYVIVICT